MAGFRASAIATKVGPPCGKPCRGFPLGSLAFARLLLFTGRAERDLLSSLRGRHGLDLDSVHVDLQRHWWQRAYGLDLHSSFNAGDVFLPLLPQVTGTTLQLALYLALITAVAVILIVSGRLHFKQSTNTGPQEDH